MDKTMRAIGIAASSSTNKANLPTDIENVTGPASSLYMTSMPTPIPLTGQALVKIHCFGLNRMDIMQRNGQYFVPPQAGPILGVESSGTIAGFGPDTESDFAIGDEVFGLAYGGAYAAYLASSTKMLIHKPKKISFAVAAGIPEVCFDVLMMGRKWDDADRARLGLLLRRLCILSAVNVLWHAGASAVSIAGIQLARAAGANKISVTASSEAKNDFCVSLGATAGFNYHTTDWVAGIVSATDGHGIDVIVDFIGKNYAQKNFEVAAKDGRIVQLGSMSGSKLDAGLDIGLLENKRLRWEGSRLRSRDLEYQGKLRDTLVEKALPKFVDGTFKVVIEKEFDWKNIREAHEYMESNAGMGKIICHVT
jgi:NADPH:quinone reductase-like Zn-dependent oxidoreductase